MNKTIYTLPLVKTNNFVDAATVISDYWKKFYSLNLNENPVYAIYTNYLKDYKEDYYFTIGIEKPFKEGNQFEVLMADYKVFNTHISEIVKAWQSIWELEQKGMLKRAYKIDFEKHYENGNVEIYIGIL